MNFKEYYKNLNEDPQTLPNFGLNPIYLKNELTNICLDGLKNNKFIKSKSKNILYMFLDLYNRVYIYFGDKGFHGATKIIIEGYEYNNTPIFTAALSKKYTSNYKNMLLKLYYAAQHEENKFIMGDKQQTQDSKSVWLKWLKNPKKYNIKESYIYDTEKEDIINYKDPEKYWGKFDKFQRYRPLVIFK